MGRSLRRREQYLGIDGLALLRLYHAKDASVADEVVAEMRTLLDSFDGDATDADIHGPYLDVASGYARWASVYDLPGNSLFAHEEPVLRRMLEALPGEPVLDAGCGTGRHVAWLSSRSVQVIGVDQSPEMLAVARAKTVDADLRVGEITALPIENRSVAGVVCALALEHVANLGAAYAEFARVVVPGGWAVISTLHPVVAQIFGWNAWFVDGEGRADVTTHLHRVSDHLNASIGAGFRLVECVEVPIRGDIVGDPESARQIVTGAPIAYADVPLILVMCLGRP